MMMMIMMMMIAGVFRLQLSLASDGYTPTFVGRYNFMSVQGICCLDMHLSILSNMPGIKGYSFVQLGLFRLI